MKKEKALQILKDYIGTGPEAEPVEFNKAIATAIKALEGKPYLAEGAEQRMMFALKPARSEDAGQFIVDVFLDDQLLHNIWCDRVTVYNGKPPMYSLYVGDFEVITLTGRLMVIYPEVKGVINEQTRAVLGDYVKVGKIRYENNQLCVDDAGSTGEGKDLHPPRVGRRVRRKV